VKEKYTLRTIYLKDLRKLAKKRAVTICSLINEAIRLLLKGEK
jgi:hypothetical protein